MSDIAIRVQNLSKRYRIGLKEEMHDSLVSIFTDFVTRPIKNLQRLRKLARFQEDGHDPEDIIWALKDVSFEVKRGEVIGIIGCNGAGKSTLLKILSHITEPTSGRVEMQGRVSSLLEVGTGFHPELTGRENIYLNGTILGMKRVEITHKFNEIVDFSGVEKFIDTVVKRYSSGMRVRLAFAVAAHLEPEILLIDEVLAVGDAAFQKKCLGKMGDVAKGGRTVLFVSHNMFSLQNLCTRGILLESGKIAMENDITAVIEKYLNLQGQQSGEICWASPNVAPGNERIRIKGIRIVSEDVVTGEVDIAKDFRIEVEYWNLEADSRRMVSFHLYNSMGICILTSGNLPTASPNPDPWYFRRYPHGLFRTSCTIPGHLLNDGSHSISLFINGSSIIDKIIRINDVLSFNAKDMEVMQREFTGKWVGTVRPHLDWQTTQLS